MITITEIRRCQSVLAQTPIGEWAKTFVELRMNFYRNYQHPFIFSTRFGADFFDELQKAFDYNQCIRPSAGEMLSEYDKNFNTWLKIVRSEK
jgi:hypothetical protein